MVLDILDVIAVSHMSSFRTLQKMKGPRYFDCMKFNPILEQVELVTKGRISI